MTRTSGHTHSQATAREVTITVNNKPVVVVGPRVTGLQIKQAAIAQGVAIQADFLLSEERPSGESQIIGDADLVTVNNQSTFTAVAGDDNS